MDEVRCSKCRREVWRIAKWPLTTAHGKRLDEEQISSHTSCTFERWHTTQVYNDGENTPEWVVNALEEGQYLSGRLKCLCGIALGRFDFVSGRRCACDVAQLPPIQLDSKKLDFVQKCKWINNKRLDIFIKRSFIVSVSILYRYIIWAILSRCSVHSLTFYSSLATSPFPPLILPVLLAAMRPILRPADVPRLTVDALPVII